MKNLNDAMKDMKITNNFEDLYFLMQISQSCGFGVLGEDHNISLATEKWKINSEWKTPSTYRLITKMVYTIGTFFKHQSEVVKTSDRQASSQRHCNGGGNID